MWPRDRGSDGDALVALFRRGLEAHDDCLPLADVEVTEAADPGPMPLP